MYGSRNQKYESKYKNINVMVSILNMIYYQIALKHV